MQFKHQELSASAQHGIEQQAYSAVSSSISRLILMHPFFGSLALRLKLVADWLTDTGYTDSVVIGFNPQFILGLTVSHRMFLVAHEVLHVVLKHTARLGHRDPHTANMAMDYVINLILKDAGFDVLKGALIDEAYRNMSWEQVYSILYKEMKDKCTCQQSGDSDGESESDGEGNEGNDASDEGNADGNEGDGSSGTPCPVHGSGSSLQEVLENGTFGEVRQAPKGTPQDEAQRQIEWETAITVAVSAEKNRGTMPGSFIDAIMGRNESVIDWKETLAMFISDSGNQFESTWSRVNRTMLGQDVYMSGMKRNGVKDLVVAIDTSGSVSPGELEQFLSETLEIAETFECRITFIPCDARIGKVQTFEPSEYPEQCDGFTITGRGGTSFEPPFTWVSDNMDESPTALIYFTDGECNYPDEPDYPVLWAISAGRWFEEAPWGTTVEVRLN